MNKNYLICIYVKEKEKELDGHIVPCIKKIGFSSNVNVEITFICKAFVAQILNKPP